MFGKLVFVVLVFIMCSSALASSQNATYHNHSLYFEIPNGWTVTKDQTDTNETKIVVSDNMSAIRIDILKKNYLSNLPKGEGYGGSEYDSYKDSVVKAQKNMCMEGGGFHIESHNISNFSAGVTCDVSDGFAEWVLLWSPSDELEFKDKVIGVHALIKTIYPTTKIPWGDFRNVETYILMPDPLFDLLASISLSDGQKKQMDMNRKINCDGSKELDLGKGSILSPVGSV